MSARSTPDASPPGPHAWARGWISDSAQLLVSQALTVVATSVAAITIARALEPGDWAIFSALLGLSMALALVADFGISTWLLRELSEIVADEKRAPTRLGSLLSSGVVVNTALAAPLVLAAAAWAAAARPEAAVIVALLSLLAYGALGACANALEALLRAQRKVRLVLAASLLDKAVLVVLLLSVAVTDAGLEGIGLSYLAAGIARVAYDGVVLRVSERVRLTRPSAHEAAAVARASFPFALNAASLNLVPRLDALVLVAMSTTSAAWFSIGDRVLGPALLVPSTLGVALYPFMATRAARRVSPWLLAGAMGLIGALIAGVGVVCAPLLVPFVFGAAYTEAVPVVQVMLLGIPVVYATSPLLVIAYSHRRERSLLLPMLGLSLAGTAAIVVGQAIGGAVLAGAGFVARFALFLLVIGAVSLLAWRRHMAEATPGEFGTPQQVSAQTP